MVFPSRWREGKLLTMTRYVHRDLDSSYGVEPDVIIIQSRPSVEANDLICNAINLQQKNMGLVDASRDGEKTIKVNPSLVAQAGKKKEFTETGQHRRRQLQQFPGFPCITQPIDRNLYDVHHQHHNPPTVPLIDQNMQSNIRKGRSKLISKTLRYFQLLLPFEKGDELGGEHIVGNDIDIRLVPLGKVTKA